MKHAIIAIEDRRFYTNDGVDLRGIGRALYQDVVQQKVVQGGSTITQQLVKNALAAQDDRTRLPEAARGRAGLPPHAQVVEGADPPQLPEHDLLRQRRLRHRGGRAHVLPAQPPGLRRARRPALRRRSSRRTRRRCWPAWSPRRAPTTRSPTPRRRTTRRNLVLQRMREQGFLTQPAVPGRRGRSRSRRAATSSRRRRTREYPYFTSWIKQQVVDQLGGGQEGARQAFEGGLTRPDDDRRRAPGRRRGGDRRRGCPTATARAPRWSRSTTTPARSARWSAATSYNELPFNLATQGQRQPGSAIKPFILAEALRQGISPELGVGARRSSSSTSRSSKEVFTVNNYEGAYSGHHHARARDDVLRQLGVRPGRHQGRHAQDRAAGRADGHPHARLAPTTR